MNPLTAFSSTTGWPSEYPDGNPTYLSLQKPKLLRGGEELPSTINLLLTGLCIYMAAMQHNWWWVIGAAWFAWPVQWFLQWVAKYDEQYFAVFFDALRHPSTREPD
jgi:type IV secretory pathway TrbD component